MSASIWTIYDSLSEQTFEGVDVPKALEILRPYSPEQLAAWFGWHAGLAEWTPVLQLPEFASLNTPIAPPKPMIPPSLKLVEEAPISDFDADKTVFDFAVSETQAQPLPQNPEPVEMPEDFGVPMQNFGSTTDEDTLAPGSTALGAGVANSPLEAVPFTPLAAAPAAPEDDPSVHIFWMSESAVGEPTPTSIDDMTSKFRYLQGHTSEPVYPTEQPVILPPESEHLASQAETMPEDRVGRLETPQRQASFPLASTTDPSQAGMTAEPTGKERRRYPRFDIRYRVIVRNDNLTFRTFSRNVSLGGVALEMAVPEALLGSECQIYVGNPKTGENIRFSGKLVANRSDSQYFVFLKSSPESLTKLQKWVESHVPVKKAV